MDVSAEIQAMADKLGVPVESIVSHIQGQQPQAEQSQAEQPQAEQPQAAAVPTETREQELERQLAESQQETQSVRRMAQTATEGRVIGSGGVGVPRSTDDLPNLGSIEPGLRYDYLNGNITDEQLAERLSPLLAALLKKHAEVGGSV